MSYVTVGKGSLFFIIRRVSEGFAEYPSLKRRAMNHPD
ncbi:hypothetical protein Pla52n_67640 [Stieleria varia]|uniref:Uncharacterized protein n=1 Tax=Stieleria varia TaxID=2528005 RepID=A0A5C5ZQJ0_9BACT|nr:hypothetical protein Pla52n_67640 [Stieleria varia]